MLNFIDHTFNNPVMVYLLQQLYNVLFCLTFVLIFGNGSCACMCMLFSFEAPALLVKGCLANLKRVLEQYGLTHVCQMSSLQANLGQNLQPRLVFCKEETFFQLDKLKILKYFPD